MIGDTPRRILVVFLALALLAVMAPANATVAGEEGKIAFYKIEDNYRGIYVMNPDGSDIVRLTDHKHDDWAPDWSPDGSRIVFVSNRSGDDALWIMDADGSNPRFLTHGANPAWSPDGQRIAFTEATPFHQVPETSIWLINVDGTGLERVTTPETDPAVVASDQISTWDTGPAWFPDGNTLLFHRWRSAIANYDMMTLDLTTATRTHIAVGHFSSGTGDVAPDGHRILYGYILDPKWPGTISMIDLETLKREVVASGGGDPSWSPTGERGVGTAAHGGIGAFDLEGNWTPLGLGWEPDWQPRHPYSVGAVDPGSGIWHLRDEDGAVNTFYYGVPGDEPFMGDWNCDGTKTPGLYRRSDGYVYLRNSNTQGVADIKYYFGIPDDIPLAGDFNGDGCDTVSLYRPTEARIYIINQLGSDDQGLGEAEHDFLFGVQGDKPFVGDFNGNGIDTIGLHRESTGRVYCRNTNTQGVADNDYIYGVPDDRLIADDWNGDGKDSPAVFRPSNITWYFRFHNTPGFADAQYIWGQSDWIPVAVR